MEYIRPFKTTRTEWPTHTLGAAYRQAKVWAKRDNCRYFIVREPNGLRYWCPNDGDLSWSWGGEEYVIVGQVIPDGQEFKG